MLPSRELIEKYRKRVSIRRQKMGGYGADSAEAYNNRIREEKSKLLDYILSKVSCNIERKPNGAKNFRFTIHGEGNCEDEKKILKYYEYHKDKRSRDERYAEYLRLKTEFENDE